MAKSRRTHKREFKQAAVRLIYVQGYSVAEAVQPGRDHWPHAMSFLFSGGGIAEGQVIGSTDRLGEHPADRRVGVGDFVATLYRHLGVDAERSTVRGPDGRPVPLLQQAGAPIRELAAAG